MVEDMPYCTCLAVHVHIDIWEFVQVIQIVNLEHIKIMMDISVVVEDGVMANN